MSTLVTRRTTKREQPPASTGPERLQKLLARGGFGSRRACEEMIRDGRVTVDGQPVTALGTKADSSTQDVRVDGVRLRAETHVYYLVNKPKGVVCTSDDPEGRRTVVALVADRRRIFAVGRLDVESRGAVILTNDGRLTNLLTHPRYGVEKTYQVRVRGRPAPEELDRLRQGIWLSEGRTLPARVWVVRERRGETDLGVALCEGKNRQVRRMFAKVGHKVLGLTRTRIGPLTLKGLGDGDHRELTANEVAMLTRIASRNTAAPAGRGRQSRLRSQGKPNPAGQELRPPPQPERDRSRGPRRRR